MCDLFTMIIMSRSNYLLVVNDCPKYRGCFACNHVIVNNDYQPESFVYNDTVDHNCV